MPLFREQFPDAEVHWQQGAGHDLFADAAPAMGRIIADWAKQLSGRFARPQRP
jgi:hypothetical protein